MSIELHCKSCDTLLEEHDGLAETCRKLRIAEAALKELSRPPLICRLIVSGMSYSNGARASTEDKLVWTGLIMRRADPDKDDQWQLFTPDDRWLWVETSCFEVVGRPPGCNTIQEAIAAGTMILLKPFVDIDPDYGRPPSRQRTP